MQTSQGKGKSPHVRCPRAAASAPAASLWAQGRGTAVCTQRVKSGKFKGKLNTSPSQ